MQNQVKSNWNQFKIDSKSIEINLKSNEIMVPHFIQDHDHQNFHINEGQKIVWGALH